MSNLYSLSIRRLFDHSFKKEWYETYWAFDVHGVILKPDYRKENKFKEAEFYPYAKETLQLISQRKDIILIMWTSSYPNEIEIYKKIFEANNIHFKYVNENPEISDAKGSFGYYEKKFYFNLMFDDKASFNPYEDWYEMYYTLKDYNDRNILPDPKWSMKYVENYHK